MLRPDETGFKWPTSIVSFDRFRKYSIDAKSRQMTIIIYLLQVRKCYLLRRNVTFIAYLSGSPNHAGPSGMWNACTMRVNVCTSFIDNFTHIFTYLLMSWMRSQEFNPCVSASLEDMLWRHVTARSQRWPNLYE